MQMKKATSYAICIIVGLAQQEQRKTVLELSKILKVKESYIKKIMKKLKDFDYVTSIYGYGGGYELKKASKDITLWDIVCIMEGNIGINYFLDECHHCSGNRKDRCFVRKVYCEMQRDIEEGLSYYTIQDLLKQTGSEIYQVDDFRKECNL